MKNRFKGVGRIYENRFNIREVFSKIKTSGFKKIKRLKQAIASKVRFLKS